MEPNPFELIPKPIGKAYGYLQKLAICRQSLPGSELYLTGPSEVLLQTMINLHPLFARYSYIGDPPPLVNPAELGWKQEMMLIVRIPAPSFGVDIRVKTMLSSMNFAEGLTLLTYCGGLIVTLYEWKSRGVVSPW